MKRLALLSSLFVLFTSTSALASKERYALITHGGTGNPFWSVVFEGAKQAAKDLGVELQILYPNTDGDQPGTTQKLAEALSTNPSGVAVTLATTGHCQYIKTARAKGTPIVTLNAQAGKSTAECPYQAYIGMNEYEAGKMQAERALKLGRVKGAALIGITEAGHAGLQARAKGIREILAKNKIRIIDADIGNDPTQVPARVKAFYEKNKKDLSALFLVSVNGIHPVIRMMEEDPQGMGKLYAATFDLTPSIIKAIEKGTVDHTIDQQPYLQGYYAVAQLVMANRGKFTPTDMNTGNGIVDQASAGAVLSLVQKKIR